MELNAFPSLRRLDISKLFFGRRLSLPPSLVELRFHKCAIGPICDLVRLHELNPTLPELRSLILSETPMKMRTIRKFLTATPSLELLHIDGCTELDNPLTPVLLNVGSFRNLVELDISGAKGVMDLDMRFLIVGLTRLKILNLSHTNITWVTVKMLADRREMHGEHPNLDCLYVEGCGEVTSDCVEYAQARGIEIRKSSLI